MSESLNENETHPAYICGRLLAVFEELQYAAQGDVNVSIVDRYYGLASTFPQQAFPKLETLSKAHLKKLRRDKPGARVVIERRIDELANLLVPMGAKYPGQLNLESQGRFAIGFHHQKAESQARRQENADKKAAEAASEATTLFQ